MASRLQQLPLPTRPSWGGARRGAGRKRTPGRRPGVPHRRRAPHQPAHPVHVTLRAVDRLHTFRAARVVAAIREALRAASRDGFRVLEFSVQRNHVHLLVEADDGARLTRGVTGLAIRTARAVNRMLGRRGHVWSDRFHARALTTPRAVRHALVYVLMNHRKHGAGTAAVDPCSSAPWFAGWANSRALVAAAPSPVVRPRTWLAAVGWRRHGLIAPDEGPNYRFGRRARALSQGSPGPTTGNSMDDLPARSS